MNLDNETMNHLIRRGIARPTFSASPNTSIWFDETGAVKPGKEKMPLVDALELLIETGIALHPDSVHPPHLVGIQLQTEVFSKVILSLARGAPIQPKLEDDPKDVERQIDAEISNARDAHKVAVKVLADLVDIEKIREKKGNKFKSKDEYTMDRFVSALKASPHPEFTKTLLSVSGPDRVQWTGPKGPLPALVLPMRPALMAERAVEVDAKVLFVRDKQSVAYVEIVSPANEYSKAVLCHHNSEVELKFDLSSTQRDDLVLLQYLGQSVRLKASAMCAVHNKFGKKTVLTLKKIAVSREKMNELHATVHQLRLPFDSETNEERPQPESPT